MDTERVVYKIDGKALADFSEAELEEWAARKRAERAMREAGSGKPKKAKAPAAEKPPVEAEDV